MVKKRKKIIFVPFRGLLKNIIGSLLNSNLIKTYRKFLSSQCNDSL